MALEIHPTAVVHPKAELGADVVVGPCAIIEENVVIGDRTTIGAFASIKAHTTLGAGNHVHAYALLGGDPQDLKYRGEKTRLIIGDNNTIREFTTLHRGTVSGHGESKIGSNCLLMAYVHIAHDCVVGDSVILSNAVMLAGHVRIDDHVSVGGMTGIHQFTSIGEYAFIGGMSGVSKDVPPYLLAVGNRAKAYGPNVIGLRRNGFSSESISALRNAYKKIWRSGTPRQEALTEVAAEFGQIAEVQKLLAFIRASTRGVVSGEREGAPVDE